MDTELVLRRAFVAHAGALLSCVASLAVTSPVCAQTASAEDIASARALGTEGVRLADSGDCVSATRKLEAAEKLYHAPTTLERLGECQVNLGQLVAGTESLNRVVREALPPSAPPAFVAAQHRAAQLLATAQPRIGKLRIHVEGAPLDKVAVTVDGASVPAALFDGDRPTDPGAHEVKGGAPGFKTATATVQLPDGGNSAVSLVLEPDPSAAGASPPAGATTAAIASPSAPGTSTPAGSAPAPNRVPAFVAFGIGGVGIAVGSVFGIMALGTKSSLDNACVNKVCPATSQSDIDALSTRATISNIGFAVGVVGVAVGAVLLVTAHGTEAPPAAATSPAARVHVSPWLGVGAAGVRGSFE